MVFTALVIIVDSFDYALYLSVRPSGTGFKFSTIDLKHRTHFTGILKKTSNSVYLFKDWSDRVIMLNSVVCLCVLIVWVTAGQLPAAVAADKERDFLYVCMFVFNHRQLSLPFRSFSLSMERLDID